MREYTNFGSIDEMFEASGFKCDTTEDFRAIPDDEWDAFIRQATRFDSWAEMKERGVNLWTKQQLGFS